MGLNPYTRAQPFALDELGPGVLGYTVEKGGAVYVPIVEAREPGRGDVGRWLDQLDQTRTWKFPAVISPILRGMLERRGFQLVWEYVEEFDEHAPMHVRMGLGA